MKIGLALPHYDFSFPDQRRASVADVVSYAKRAEALGFDSVWISDHVFLDLARYGGPAQRYDTPDAMTMLAAIAAGTQRVRFGPLVLCAPFRNTRIAAHQLATIDELSGGRLDAGLGAGWYEPEFDEAGIPFGTVGGRIRALDEAAAQTRALLDGVPLWIGGKGGPKIAGLVARHADGWNIVWGVAPDDYRDKLRVLEEACNAAGRDPGSVRLSVGLPAMIGTDEQDVAARWERFRLWGPSSRLNDMDLQTFAETGLAGTADQCAARAREFADLGVELLILNFAGLPFSLAEDELLEVAAAELLPLVR